MSKKNSCFFYCGDAIYPLLGLLGLLEVIYVIYDIHLIRYLISGIIILYLIAVFSVKREHDSFLLEKKIYFRLFLFWTCIIALNGLLFSNTTIKDFCLNSSLFLAFTFPFLYRIYHSESLTIIIRVVFLCDIIYLFISYLFLDLRLGTSDIYNISFVEFSCKYLAYPNLLLILLFPKLTFKYKLVSILTFIVSLLYVIFEARRALLFTLCCGLVFSFFLFYKTLNKVRHKLLFYVFFLLVILFFGNLYLEIQDTFLRFLLSRMDSDSRSTINQDFFLEMSYLDILVGRGIGGQFATTSSALGITDGWGRSFRDGIETGVLDYILKGGIIYLFFLLIIYFKAIYNGLFKSKNYIAKALSLFILLHVFELYPSGTPLFSFRYCIIWFCVFACYDQTFLKKQSYEISL